MMAARWSGPHDGLDRRHSSTRRGDAVPIHPPRVLHVQKAHGLGGSERHIIELCRALAPLGVSARVLWLESPRHPLDSLEAFARARGVESGRLAIRGHLDPGLPRRLRAWLRANPADLLHLHLIHATLYGVLAAGAGPAPPLVASRHGAEPYRRLPWFGWVQRRLDRRCARVIVPSAHLARFAARWDGTPRGKIRVIPHGLAPEWFAPPDAAARERARAGWGVRPGEIVLGAVARLHPAKDHATLLRAFASVRRVRPEARLVLIGGGPRRAALGALARRLLAAAPEAVRFEGEREADRDLYGAFDVAVLPTRREGFGLAALEAMAAGLPLAASRAGAIPEIVRDGENGLLVESGSPTALAAALARLLAEPGLRRALGERASETARAFTAERMARATAEVYREALAAR
jgi:glycosyltransferase involved in cell wall biosynthesis